MRKQSCKLFIGVLCITLGTGLLSIKRWYPNVSVRINPNQQPKGFDSNNYETRHIGFLKVHKAGSSTLQNIIFRFGMKRNLTFVLPRNGNFFNAARTLPVPPGGHYDILAIHSSYRKEDYDRLLPEDKVNIAIVREPIVRLISAAFYYRDVFNVGHLRKVPKTNFIHELISRPEKYERASFSETKNSMGKDFGFKATMKVTDTDKIKQKIYSLDKEFFLVLITDRFDESLVLMRRRLNWKLSDMLYIARNTHEHQPVIITEKLREKYRNTSFMDFALYDHFAKIFDEKVIAEGPAFHQEVQYLQHVLKKTASFCENDRSKRASLFIPASAWNDGFKVSDSDCTLMQMNGLEFLADLRARHIRMNGNLKH